MKTPEAKPSAETKNLSNKMEQIINEGSSKVVCVLDFDKTMTYPFWNGKNVSTSFSQFRDLNLIDEEYTRESRELFTHYHPIEISTELGNEEKPSKMAEWWEKHLALFVKYGITKEHVAGVVEKGNINLRRDVRRFFEICNNKNIPIVVLSAGLGDVIVGILKKEGIDYPNVTVVSNFFDFNNEGVATNHTTPIIHSLNKNETQLPREIQEKLSSRTNVVLAGDSVSDLGMSEGLQSINVLSFGFLNDSETHAREFETEFDMVLPGKEEDFSVLTDLLEKLDYPMFKDSDPRREMLGRIIANKGEVKDNDDNATLVKKAIDAIKKTTFTSSDFEALKEEAFALSPKVFDKYADMLTREIERSDSPEIVIASFGSGIYGHIEKMLSESINRKLGENKKNIRFVGLDIYKPDDFSGSFFESDNFYKLDKDDDRNFGEIVGIKDGQKLIITANYALHHQKAKLHEFIKRCEGATTIILDEPVDRKKWENKNYRFSVIAYDLLANIAINPEWAKSFLENPDEFFVDYLFTDELDEVGIENLYFESTPLSTLTRI